MVAIRLTAQHTESAQMTLRTILFLKKIYKSISKRINPCVKRYTIPFALSVLRNFMRKKLSLFVVGYGAPTKSLDLP